MAGRPDAERVFTELLSLLDRNGAAVAFYHDRAPDGQVSRSQFIADVRSFAVVIAEHALAASPDGASPGGASPGGASPGGPGTGAWVGVRDRYLQVVATLGALGSGPAALVEADGPAAMFDTLARACPPALVVADEADAGPARWAVARGVPLHLISRPAGGWPAAQGSASASGAVGREDSPEALLRFFTSGTTGPVKCIGVGRSQLIAAVIGVGARLALTEGDTSLSVAPLTHTLGMVTEVLAALVAGGTVAFADVQRSAAVAAVIGSARPTWCAASPSGLRLVASAVATHRQPWPGLRFLRSSSAPLPGELADQLEGRFGVPAVNAYVMTEAPGEIASQDLVLGGARGSVGRPTLCEVEVRSPDGQVLAGAEGQIWIRGPNVAMPPEAVAAGAVAAGTVTAEMAAAGTAGGPRPWLRTGDIGVLAKDGSLAITGRSHDIINSGGLKVWPPEVEAVALRHPDVRAAVAFPIPHKGLGETIGLAVVPCAGRSVDRSAVRRLLMSDLPRDKWPTTIVVCGQIPLTPRGKLSRRGIWQQLGIEAR
jgi:acyl-CoA synthetase (AMP-forming)/AMP-acid ligase II